MSTTTTTTALAIPSDPAAIGEAYGLPVIESKEVQAHLKAIKAAAPGDLVSALEEHGRPLYADTSALHRDVEAARKFATQGKAAADHADAMAVRLVMTARQVNPKIAATTIGRAVEGPDASGAAMRKRWSRYANAAEMTAARAAAIKAGKTTDNLTVREALLALQNQYAPVDTLKAIAAEGGALPGKPEDSAKPERAPKAVTGADIVAAVERLSDTVKAADLSTLTPEQATLIASLMTSVRTRLGSAVK